MSNQASRARGLQRRRGPRVRAVRLLVSMAVLAACGWAPLPDATAQPTVPVACCLPSGQCIQIDYAQCVALGGIPYGPGSTCTQIACNPVKWSQPPMYSPASPFPDCFWGWDEFSHYFCCQIVADDWLCQDARPVTDIHWWGSYRQWIDPIPPPDGPDAFHLGIWTDVPVGPNNPFPFSHPGMLIWEFVVPRGATREMFVGCDFHPDFGREATFQYEVVLPPDRWFDQGGATDQVYWLSVSAIYPMPPVMPWGWKTREHFFNDDAVIILDPTAPLPGMEFGFGEPIERPPGVSWDMAFALTSTAPQTEACCLRDGSCIDLPPYDCIVLRGGVPEGPGTTCASGIVCPFAKWTQPPRTDPAVPAEGFFGWDELSIYHSETTPRQFVADDFYCLDDRPIMDVHWWGSYVGWLDDVPPPTAPVAFQIGIWTDVPATTDPPFSHPGRLIWQRIVRRDGLNERPIARDYFPDRPADTCFQYDLVLPQPDWFYQEDGRQRIYWLSVAAMYAPACNADFDNNGRVDAADLNFFMACFSGSPDPRCWRADMNGDGLINALDLSLFQCQLAAGWPDPNCCGPVAAPPEFPWGWKTRRHFWNDDAVRVFVPSAPFVGVLYEIGEPILELGESWDMAFVLTTMIPPTIQACCFNQSCVDVDPFDCVTQLGGRAQGVGSTCVSAQPQVVTQPVSQVVCEDDPVSFTIAVASPEPPSYQWRRNGLPIPGATGPTYAIAAAQLSDAGVYDCLVRTVCGITFSMPASLFVWQPADSNCDGRVDNFDIDAFVLALVGGQAAWESQYSCRYLCANDVNRDGRVDNFDIDPFVVCILNNGCP